MTSYAGNCGWPHGRVQPRIFFLTFILGAATAWAAFATPDRVPQRVLLGITGDPAHSQSVTWRTAAPVESPQAQIAPCAGAPAFGNAAVTVNARSAEYPTGSGVKAVHYEATFTNLDVGGRYAYRVGDGTTWSEWFQIRTAQDKDDPFRFIYLGDAQLELKSLWSRTVREAFRCAPEASFVLRAGDLIDNGFDDALWGGMARRLSGSLHKFGNVFYPAAFVAVPTSV